jgi:hypothetical protein
MWAKILASLGSNKIERKRGGGGISLCVQKKECLDQRNPLGCLFTRNTCTLGGFLSSLKVAEEIIEFKTQAHPFHAYTPNPVDVFVFSFAVDPNLEMCGCGRGTAASERYVRQCSRSADGAASKSLEILSAVMWFDLLFLNDMYGSWL